jgi:thioesterase domain-containing protein/acyl carrier protein
LSVAELLDRLRRSEIRIRADGDRLKVSGPPGALTAELSDGIREYKQQLLRLLAETDGLVVRRLGEQATRRAASQQRYPLSPAQRRAAAVDATAAMLPSAFRMTGPLDVAALQETLRAITARHAPMRSCFELDAVPPMQTVQSAASVDLPLTDLSGLPPADRATTLQRLLVEQARTPLDLPRTGPFRYHLFRDAADGHVLFAGFSPLIFDGWCFDIFWNELRSGYGAIRAGRSAYATELTVSYADLVAQQQQRVADQEGRLASFWRSALGEELPPLPLPTDFPRPPLTARRGEGLPFALSAETVALLAGASRTFAVTPQMLMLAGLFAWVARLGGQDENVIATPVDARMQSASENVIGPFANILLMRFRVDVTRGLAATLPALRAACLDAYQHQEYPLDRVDARPSRRARDRFAPAFQVEFSYQMVHGRGSAMADLTLSQVELESGAAANDLTLWVKDWGTRIDGAVEFRPELFERRTVAHWFECYKNLLTAALREPERPLAELDVLGAEIDTVNRARSLANGAPADIVDARGMPVPVGVPGRLRDGDGSTCRLRHDGRVERCDGDVGGVPATAVGGEQPATAMEWRLAELFAQVLGVESVGAAHRFFELGGTSIKAVRLFTRIHEIYGVRLPLTAILTADTPRALAAAINGTVRGREGSLVELKPGSGGKCLFVIHDADGESLLYRELGRRLPDTVAVVGVEPLGRGDLPVVHTSIEEFAAHYVREIRQRQPHGPYAIGGLCAGGLFAFEITRQLRAAGETVGLLVLIECGTPTAPKRRTSSLTARMMGLLASSAAAQRTPRFREIVRKLVGYARFAAERRAMRARSRRQLRAMRATDSGAAWPSSVPLPTMRTVWNAIETAYRPAPLANQVAVLYRAATGSGSDLPYRDLLSDPLFGWGAVLGAGLVAVDVPGGHFSALREPNVDVIAADLGPRLAAIALAGNGVTR